MAAMSRLNNSVNDINNNIAHKDRLHLDNMWMHILLIEFGQAYESMEKVLPHRSGTKYTIQLGNHLGLASSVRVWYINVEHFTLKKNK